MYVCHALALPYVPAGGFHNSQHYVCAFLEGSIISRYVPSPMGTIIIGRDPEICHVCMWWACGIGYVYVFKKFKFSCEMYYDFSSCETLFHMCYLYENPKSGYELYSLSFQLTVYLPISGDGVWEIMKVMKYNILCKSTSWSVLHVERKACIWGMFCNSFNYE